jgi:UDP-N-acetylglucosamine 2-epimerase (non-hydrolysing)
MKHKVITVLGTRPELIRLSSLIKALDNHPFIDHRWVHTGQNNQPFLHDVFLKDLSLRIPDYQLQSEKLYRVDYRIRLEKQLVTIFEKEKPAVCIVLGDTYSALAALVAKSMHIKFVHLEAGNRCYDPKSPEEKNRTILDQEAHLNGCYSEEAQDHLRQENLVTPSFISGSPLREVYEKLKSNHRSKVLTHLQLSPHEYYVWSTHRAENIDDPNDLHHVVSALITLATWDSQKPIIVTGHPRFIEKLSHANVTLPNNININEPFNLIDYLMLQQHAYAVLSDSGSLNEEADILGFHGINLRSSHERAEAEKIPVTDLTHFDWYKIQASLMKRKTNPPQKDRVIAYRQNNFSSIVLNRILSILT